MSLPSLKDPTGWSSSCIGIFQDFVHASYIVYTLYILMITSSHRTSLSSARRHLRSLLHSRLLERLPSLHQRRIPLLPPPHLPLYPLNLSFDILPVIRYLMRLFGSRPEVLYAESVFEVGAEVVHPAYGEQEVHSELKQSVVVTVKRRGDSAHLEDFEV